MHYLAKIEVSSLKITNSSFLESQKRLLKLIEFGGILTKSEWLTFEILDKVFHRKSLLSALV